MIRLKTIPLAIITVVAILGGVSIAKATGYYETRSTKQPAKFRTGELAGKPNPADIRGSYTWLDIEKAFDIPSSEATKAFSTPEHILDPASRVSVLEEIYEGKLPEGFEIGTGAVRVFVSLYTGLPLEFEKGSVLPGPVLSLLASRPGANHALLETLIIPGSSEPVLEIKPSTTPENAVIDLVSKISESAPTKGTTPETEKTSGTGVGTGAGTGISLGVQGGGGGGIGSTSSKMVVGKTTFGDLYDWGLTEAQVTTVLGYKPGPKSQSIRENAMANGREFSDFRTAFQTLLDSSAP